MAHPPLRNDDVIDPADLDALSLSRAIHQKRITCEQVMERSLDRIQRLNPKINAIVSLRGIADLLAEARERDRELEAGRSRGWLHGVPFAVKDLSEAKGITCAYGSPIYKNFVPDFDDIQVERIKGAGAIVIGKTNTPEWGFGSHSYNPVFGVTRNPYDTSKSAGGSSGGAGAALAARLVPVADGSDMMGSLRNPAAFNNVVGFRPSFGRIPGLPGKDVYMNQLAVLGPMARNVADVTALLNIQSGFDARDPLSLPEEPVRLREDFDPSGLNVGWLGDFGGYLPFEPGVLELGRASLSVFERMGCRVSEVLPDFDMDRLWWAWTTLRGWLTAGSLRGHYENPAERALLKPEILFEIRAGLKVTAEDVYEASAVRTAWLQAVLKLFERHDFLILPAAQVFPFDADIPWPREIAGRKMDTYHRWMEVVIGPSMAGLPVAAMPAGFGTGGLPAGIQIIGRPRADAAVLDFAQAYERATDWLEKRPPLG